MAKKLLPEVTPMGERKPTFSLQDKDYDFIKDLKFNQEVGLKVSAIVKRIDEDEFEKEKPVNYEFQIQSVEALKGDEKIKKSAEKEEKTKKAVKIIKKKSKTTDIASIVAKALRGKV